VTPRTVYLSYVFPPDAAPRAVQVARLVRHSALPDLHVVCATEGAGGERVHTVPWGPLARARRAVRWRTIRSRLLAPDAFRPWAADAARAAAALRPRVLVTFGQPMSDHLAGLRLRRRRADLRWIAHFSDPWSANPFRDEDAVARWTNRRLERAVLERADALVFTSAETVDLVLGGPLERLRHKAHVLPHCYEPGAYRAPAPRAAGAPLVVRHLGAFYGTRTPAALFAALARVGAERPDALADVRVELYGPMERPLDTVPGHDRLPPGLVHWGGVVPHERSLELMADADLLVVLDAPAPLSVFLPSKLVDYVGARRPLLALTPPGAAAALVARAGGWVAAPGDPAACAAALGSALAAARAAGPGPWGAPEVAAELAAPAVAARMDALVRTVGEAA